MNPDAVWIKLLDILTTDKNNRNKISINNNNNSRNNNNNVSRNDIKIWLVITSKFYLHLRNALNAIKAFTTLTRHSSTQSWNQSDMHWYA